MDEQEDKKGNEVLILDQASNVNLQLRDMMMLEMERMCESIRSNLVESLFKRYPRPKIRWSGGRVMVYEISKKNKHYKFKKGERK